MLIQHHPTLLDAICWRRLNTMLENVGLSLNLLKIFVQQRATLLAQQCCTILASFEQAFKSLENGCRPPIGSTKFQSTHELMV